MKKLLLFFIIMLLCCKFAQNKSFGNSTILKRSLDNFSRYEKTEEKIFEEQLLFADSALNEELEIIALNLSEKKIQKIIDKTSLDMTIEIRELVQKKTSPFIVTSLKEGSDSSNLNKH